MPLMITLNLNQKIEKSIKMIGRMRESNQQKKKKFLALCIITV